MSARAMEHAEHVTADVISGLCVDGECEHQADECPLFAVEVCVDCMDEMGLGRNVEDWEEVSVRLWPHEEDR